MAEFGVEERGELAVWTIDGEARRNAISRAMAVELESLVQKTTSRVVVLTGAGDKAFCAGADLKERAGMSEDQVRSFLDGLRRTLRRLEQKDTIFIAALNGVALGGGTELALACDLRVAATHAELGLTEVKLGIIPGGGGTQRLPRLIGKGRAKSLILTGRRIGAAEALSWGLVDQVADAALPKAIALAETIAQNGPLAVAAAKRAVDEGSGLDLDEALALELRHYERVLASEDRLEGLKAFAEKRAPVFKGR